MIITMIINLAIIIIGNGNIYISYDVYLDKPFMHQG